MSEFYQIDRIFKNKGLNDSDKNILAYILKNPDKVQHQGIRTLAEHVFTSPTSIERLAKKLGYSGYSELVYHAKHLIRETTLPQPSSLDTLTTLSPEIFEDRVVQLFNREHYVYIYGEGFNEFVAGYFYRKLLVNRYQTLLLAGLEIPLVYDPGQKPVLLLISRSGENFSCLEKIRQIEAVNGTLISFTSNANSTIAKKSDVPITLVDPQVSDAANINYTHFYGDCINAFENLLNFANLDPSES
jgi:DNA-binding MurR/RpiR family transcriptional regulator